MSGSTAAPPSGGVKYDGGKVRVGLIPIYPLWTVAQVYTMGAAKYADNNWRLGMQWSRVFDATLRHLYSFWNGEDIDPESGLPHPAHAAFGCLTLIEYMKTHRELDDRYGEQARNNVLSERTQTPSG